MNNNIAISTDNQPNTGVFLPRVTAALLACFLAFSTAAEADSSALPHVGDLRIEVIGEGADLVFIPGLNSGADAFAEVCAALVERYRCHLLQLPGFAGAPPLDNAADGFIPVMADQIAAYILKPDVLLLDIQLPDGDGFKLLEQLEHLPLVIFTTAYDQHAVSAFEVNALDYLLKPIEQARLLQSLTRAKQKLNDEIGAAENKPLLDKIFIRDGERYYFVRLKEIVMFEVDGNYTRVHCRDKKPLLARSLNYLEQRLRPQQFFRANRQLIINLDYVSEVEPWVNDGLRVTLQTGQHIEVSRRQTKALLSLLEV